MGLSGCYGIIKFLIFIINLLFWLVGLAVVILALWMLTDSTFYISMAQDQSDYNIGVAIFLVAGIMMVIVGFLGCCGTYKESQCMLISFFSCLLVILVAQIAAGAWAYYNSDSLEGIVRSSIKTTVKEEYGVIHSRTVAFDTLQKGLECCGANGPSDWNDSKYNMKGKEGIQLAISQLAIMYKIPESCCRDKVSNDDCRKYTNVGVGAIIGQAIYTDGCMDKFVYIMKDHSKIVCGLALATIVVEVIGLLFALILCFAINRSDRYKA